MIGVATRGGAKVVPVERRIRMQWALAIVLKRTTTGMLAGTNAHAPGACASTATSGEQTRGERGGVDKDQPSQIDSLGLGPWCPSTNWIPIHQKTKGPKKKKANTVMALTRRTRQTRLGGPSRGWRMTHHGRVGIGRMVASSAWSTLPTWIGARSRATREVSERTQPTRLLEQGSRSNAGCHRPGKHAQEPYTIRPIILTNAPTQHQNQHHQMHALHTNYYCSATDRAGRG